MSEYERDENDWRLCHKCHGEGVVHAHSMGVITPMSEPADIPGDYYVCPVCLGLGQEP